MPRKILQLSLAGVDGVKSSGDWERLGFTLDFAHGGFLLADGATVDFRAAGPVSAGLSGAPGEAPPRAADPAASCFTLTTPRAGAAPAHVNGAHGVRALAAVSESPSDHAEFLSALTGQREMLATSAGLEIKLDGGVRLDVLSPPAFAYHFGAPPRESAFHIAGLVFAVENLAATDAFLRGNGLTPQLHAGRLTTGAIQGIAIAFEQA